MSFIIDAHSHYMPPEVAQNTMFFKVGWSDIEGQLARMDQHGIQKALLLYPTSDAHLNMGGWKGVCDVYNPAIAGIVERYPGRFIGAGILPVDEPQKFASELQRIKSLNLKVLSLASSYEGVYLDDERFDCVYEFAAQNRMPVHVHSQILNPVGSERVKDPLLSPVLEYVFDVSMAVGKMMMSGTFLKFPDVDFIFAHYGGVIPFVKERFDNTYLMLRRRELVKDLSKNPSAYFKNLYFDTSGSQSAASLQCMLEVTDAGHILFGSDTPANQSLEQSLSVLRQAPMAESERVQILENNLLKSL